MSASYRISALSVSIAAFACFGNASAQSIALPIPRVTIYPGEVINESMLQWRNFEQRSVQENLVASTIEAVSGNAARRTLVAGQPIPRAAIGKPHVLKQGQSALAVYETGGLRITCAIVLLEGGGIGDVVRARNVETSAVVTGTIKADGSLRVN